VNKLKSFERLENSLSKLPSVGKKSAERMAFAMLNMSDDDLAEFSNAIIDFKTHIKKCPICGMLIDTDSCEICDNPSRDHSTIMVVSFPKDVFAIEKSEGFNGVYHVLNGEISISKGIGVEDLRIKELIQRVEEENIKEIILATNPTIDGETTALYLNKLLAKYNVQTTRLAYGLQMGGNLDYTDQLTLLKALEGRRRI